MFPYISNQTVSLCYFFVDFPCLFSNKHDIIFICDLLFS